MTPDITPQLKKARQAGYRLLDTTDDRRNRLLLDLADRIEAAIPAILAANKMDTDAADATSPLFDRLVLNADRIKGMAHDLRNVATLPSPLVQLEERTLPNGINLRRVAVPFGVIGVIYEARPNVTTDVFSLCFKTANAVVLKGGHEADHTNRVLADIIRDTLREHGLPEDAVTLLPADREATAQLLQARGLVDLLIPRGSARLIDTVRRQAKIPVIETGAGVCHCYIAQSARTEMAAAIVNNAKTRRVSVCNALDCIIMNRRRLADLPAVCEPLVENGVKIYADADAFAALNGHYPATLLGTADAESFGTEFLGYSLAVKTVDNTDEAIDHINRYGSGHSESIVTQDAAEAHRFQQQVDAACVYWNVPTSFTDGAQFGLGAEIGISTQKLHARGPMALRELTTYKWLLSGNGQTRP